MGKKHMRGGGISFIKKHITQITPKGSRITLRAFVAWTSRFVGPGKSILTIEVCSFVSQKTGKKEKKVQ
jgi:hypothetical protein